jgi:hypothetical protein
MPSAEVQQVKQEQELSWPPDIQVSCLTTTIIPVFLRDVCIRTQRAAIASSKQAGYQLCTHLPLSQKYKMDEISKGEANTLQYSPPKKYKNIIPVFHFRVLFWESR